VKRIFFKTQDQPLGRARMGCGAQMASGLLDFEEKELASVAIVLDPGYSLDIP
jgi:hypothetical protein